MKKFSINLIVARKWNSMVSCGNRTKNTYSHFLHSSKTFVLENQSPSVYLSQYFFCRFYFTLFGFMFTIQKEKIIN